MSPSAPIAPAGGVVRAAGAENAAIVVLGCAVRMTPTGRLAAGALARRIEAAARLYMECANERVVVIASGGRRWGDFVEADVMADELRAHGVPAQAIVRERCSLSTRDNARFSAAALARRGHSAAYLVTCPWHLPRAAELFVRAGIRPVPIGAPSRRPPSPLRAAWQGLREGVLTWLECPPRRGAPKATPWLRTR